MRSACTALAIATAVSFAARAEEGKDALALDSAVPRLSLSSEPTFAQFVGDDDAPSRYRRRRAPQARQGLLVSFGLGGGSLYVSNLGRQRAGAFDFDARLGFGFSDRFQMFMDFTEDAGTHPNGTDLASWTFTVRGQTVLIGDRAGNGLNANFGVGLGGVTYNGGYLYQSSPTGLALAGGISYDARLSPWFSFSPEFFVTWHQVPNGPGYADDVASIYGLRINFLWYLH